MSLTVFDILTTNLSNESSGELKSSEEELYLSIRDHLQRLLNSRRGSLTHLPHYGMPDIAAMYLGLPYSGDRIIACIRQCVTDFEPRLGQPLVRAVQLDNGKDVTPFEIIGETPQGRRLKFVASLYRNGNIDVVTSWEHYPHG